MIFLILNIFLVGVLIWFSSYEEKIADEKKSKPLINFALLLCVTTVLNSICILLSIIDTAQLNNVLAKLGFVLCGYLSVLFFRYTIKFPFFKKSVLLDIVCYILLAAFVYIVFTKVQRISINMTYGYQVESLPMGFLPFTWFEGILFLFAIGFPGLTIVSGLLRLESLKSRIYRQQMLWIVLSTLLFVGTLYLICIKANASVPGYALLFPCAYGLLVFLLSRIVSQSALYDIRSVFDRLLSFIVIYLLPSVIAGLIFGLLQPIRQSNIVIFILLYAVCVTGLLVCSYQVTKIFRKKMRTRDSNYSHTFENELASLDYTDSSEEFIQKIYDIFTRNVHTSKFDILIEEDQELKTLHSADGKKTVISLQNPLFDVALNAHKTILFKSQIDSSHFLSNARKDLEEIFAKTNSEVLIILNEGRRVFGAILLGEKHLGNAYSDYDYGVFSNLYSYFFLIGYYLKNIANESVVGTVNREIQMSGQIIQSIQENMDFINNPKADIGYISVAAHNLGGEYIDFIRLNEDRHIIVLGDLSGKGINASMSMVILKSIVRTFLAETTDFKQLVLKVNSFIRENLPKETFFEGVFCLMDFTDNTLYYINCGIPALFMYNQAYNNVVEIQGEGRVLGFIRNIDKLLKVKKVKLNPGDMILGCTDGVLDEKSIRGENFGKARVQKSMLSNLSFPAEKMSQFLYSELLEFTSKELEDDVSALIIKCISK